MTNFVISPMKSLLATYGSFKQTPTTENICNEQLKYVLKKVDANIMSQIVSHNV